LLREVKTNAGNLHADIDKLRAQNGHLKDKMSQVGVAHEEEVRKLRAIQTDIQMQLDTQLRHGADKERANRLLQQVHKEALQRIDEMEKQLRTCMATVQELEDEVARLETQREDLKNGNAAARESLRKASSDMKAMQAKIESLSEQLDQVERAKRDGLAQIEDRDFKISEMEKQLDIAAAKHKDLQSDLERIQQVQTVYCALHPHCVRFFPHVTTLFVNFLQTI
jgi:chromosome segregation ATPase